MEKKRATLLYALLFPQTYTRKEGLKYIRNTGFLVNKFLGWVNNFLYLSSLVYMRKYEVTFQTKTKIVTMTKPPVILLAFSSKQKKTTLNHEITYLLQHSCRYTMFPLANVSQ